MRYPFHDPLLEDQPEVIAKLEEVGYHCYGRDGATVRVVADAGNYPYYDRYLWQRSMRSSGSGAGTDERDVCVNLWHYPAWMEAAEKWEVEGYFERAKESPLDDACLCRLYGYSTEQLLARLEALEDAITLAAGLMMVRAQQELRAFTPADNR